MAAENTVTVKLRTLVLILSGVIARLIPGPLAADIAMSILFGVLLTMSPWWLAGINSSASTVTTSG